jgi:hypothetical protein
MSPVDSADKLHDVFIVDRISDVVTARGRFEIAIDSQVYAKARSAVPLLRIHSVMPDELDPFYKQAQMARLRIHRCMSVSAEQETPGWQRARSDDGSTKHETRHTSVLLTDLRGKKGSDVMRLSFGRLFLRHLGQRGERGRVSDGDLRQHLSIDRHASSFETAH